MRSDSRLPRLLRHAGVAAAGFAAFLLAVPASAAAPTGPREVYAVRQVLNVTYCDGAAADAVQHRLDLFLPEGKKDFPVVVFVHGGAWMLLDKSWGGLYSNVGRCLAEQGIAAVLPNYRLSPGVKHPAHIQDVARAVAWTVRNIGRYGGRPDELFLAGHSAGGHLASLLATDPTYLKAVGVNPALVRGVISVSGVYDLSRLSLNVALPGAASKVAAAAASLLRLPGVNLGAAAAGSGSAGSGGPVDLRLSPLAVVFGDDPRVSQDASPLYHVHPGLPPFLVVNADRDLPTLPEMARRFVAALRKDRVPVETLTVANRDHESLMWQADNPADPVAHAMSRFAEEHATTAGPSP